MQTEKIYMISDAAKNVKVEAHVPLLGGRVKASGQA